MALALISQSEALVNRIKHAVSSAKIPFIGAADVQAATWLCSESRVKPPASDKPADVLDSLTRCGLYDAASQQAIVEHVEPVLEVEEPEPTTVDELDISTSSKRSMADVGLKTIEEARVYDTTGPGLTTVPGIGLTRANRIRQLIGLEKKPEEQK